MKRILLKKKNLIVRMFTSGWLLEVSFGSLSMFVVNRFYSNAAFLLLSIIFFFLNVINY